MGKDRCQIKTVEEQEEEPKRPSLSQYDPNRRQRQKFQGHCLQSQAFLSKNFGTPVITGDWGTIKGPPEPRQTGGQKTRTWRQDRKPLRILGGLIQATLTDKRDIEGTLKSRFLQTVQVEHGWEASASKYLRFWTTPYKTKLKPNGQIPTVIDKSCTNMGGSSASHNNPDKGRAGNCKTKIQIVWIMCRPVIENAQGVWLLNNNRSFLIYKNLKCLCL